MSEKPNPVLYKDRKCRMNDAECLLAIGTVCSLYFTHQNYQNGLCRYIERGEKNVVIQKE